MGIRSDTGPQNPNQDSFPPASNNTIDWITTHNFDSFVPLIFRTETRNRIAVPAEYPASILGTESDPGKETRTYRSINMFLRQSQGQAIGNLN
jgi:hypothetical protein